MSVITGQNGDGSSVLGRLARYVGAATLARTADAGAGVGLLLLCLARADVVGRPVVTGGVLTAALAAPHLLGPLLGRWLDGAADGRRVLALACCGYAVGLGTATVLLGRVPIGVVLVLVAAAGVCGPLLTGGLSSRLEPMLADPRGVEGGTGGGLGAARGAGLRRRAEGFDVTTYGLAGSLGPAAVAGLATLTSPLTALLALSGAAMVAAGLVGTLPATSRPSGDRPPMGVRQVLGLIAGSGPLRRVTAATMVTALACGGLGVAAVVLADRLGTGPGAGGVLAAAFGVGNLAGSVLVTVVPARSEPELATLRWILVVSAGLLAAALAPTYAVALAGYVLAGIGTAPYVAATLRARSQYAPDAARAQVFVAVSALKVAAGSAGAALAGVICASSPRLLLLLAGASIALSVLGLGLDRRRSRPTTGGR